MYRLPLLCALLALALGAVAPTVASASKRSEIIKDCADDGRLQGKYSAAEIRDARKHLPADVDEYTDCRDALRRAELPEGGSGAIGGGGTSGGQFGGTSGSSKEDPGYRTGSDGRLLQTPYNKDDDDRLAQARKEAGEPVALGDRRIQPGRPASADTSTAGLPDPVLLVLILLGLAALGSAVWVARKRVLHRRPA